MSDCGEPRPSQTVRHIEMLRQQLKGTREAWTDADCAGYSTGEDRTKSDPTACLEMNENTGGDNGARTRDLRRDRKKAGRATSAARL